MYDYGARNYDPALGRWMNIDPLAEHSPSKTSYHYCSNNPINRIDPTGMCDDPNCPHGALRRGWDSLGRGLGLWGYSDSNKQSNVQAGPIQEVDPQSPEEQEKYAQDIRNLNDKFGGFILGLAELLTFSAGGEATEVGEATTVAKETLTEANQFSKIGSTGKVGEDALKLLGGESQVYIKTSEGGRYVDQLVGGVANESKVGYTSLTKSVKTQIAKDAEIVKNGTGGVESSVWHFFQSPVTGKGGATQPLLKELEKNGIKAVNH